MTEPERTFVRGNDRLERLLADPDIAAEVAKAHESAEEMDRVHAMNLAMIRKGGQLTAAQPMLLAPSRDSRMMSA
ncbi:hypothetical protein OHB01_10835 [Microbispora hainanensis]|uniref:hypothetical protein n=1 Tax=Microbispora TaxID=2005 RepID=UPI00164F4BFE|nr:MULTISPECIES: hypothetical protein [Microbispora]